MSGKVTGTPVAASTQRLPGSAALNLMRPGAAAGRMNWPAPSVVVF
jgi:hypothetical protein